MFDCALCSVETVLCAIDRAADRALCRSSLPTLTDRPGLLLLNNSSERSTGRSITILISSCACFCAWCLRLRLIFYFAPLNFDLCAILFNKLNNSTNKILHFLLTILHLGEDFSNLSPHNESTNFRSSNWLYHYGCLRTHAQ